MEVNTVFLLLSILVSGIVLAKAYNYLFREKSSEVANEPDQTRRETERALKGFTIHDRPFKESAGKYLYDIVMSIEPVETNLDRLSHYDFLNMHKERILFFTNEGIKRVQETDFHIENIAAKDYITEKIESYLLKHGYRIVPGSLHPNNRREGAREIRVD